MTNSYLEELRASYNLKKLIKQPTCFKNLENPTCTDHILANHPKSFHSPSVFVTCLSDFHKLTLTVLNVFDLLPNRLKNSKTDKTPAKVSYILYKLCGGMVVFLFKYTIRERSLENLILLSFLT